MQTKISLGTTVKSSIVDNKELSYDELKVLLTTYKKVPTKTDLPYFIAGHFSNSRRNTETMKSRTLIVLDVDKFKSDQIKLTEKLNKELSTYKYIAYSTISHTPEHPKIRIVLFLTKEIDKENYCLISTNFINTLSFKDAIDKCSTKANQFMFLPGYIEDSYQKFVKINNGSPIDPYLFRLASTPLEKGSDDLLSMIANKPLNLTNDEIQNYLNQYDISSTDYHARIQTGMSLHHQFQGSMYGCSLWKEWLLKHPSHAESTTLQQIEKKWASFSTNSNNPTTFASIIKIVNEQKVKISFDNFSNYVHPLSSDIWQDTEGKYRRPIDSLCNFEILLKEYKITLQYDIIGKDEIIVHPGYDESNNNKLNDGIGYIRNCCKINKMHTGDIREMVSIIANKNKINPFLNWIKSAAWDKKTRLNDFYDTVQTSKENDELKQIYLKKWCMSAIHLSCLNAELKGKFAKGVLVFQGVQNAGKTSWFRSLLPSEMHKYQDDGITIDPNNTYSILACIKNVMIELGEIDSTFKKTDISRLKQFITKTSDTLCLKYEGKHRSFTRQTVFFGSVNDYNFLVDDTGNTRFMILPVLKINYDHKIDMQQFWAEILYYCEQKEQYWLNENEIKMQEKLNQEHYQLCPYEEKIRLNFDLQLSHDVNLSATRILEILGYTNISKKQTNEIARTLDRMGFTRGSSKIKGWFLPRKKNIFDDVEITT